MSAWTADRVLSLAPDPASAKAGQGLAGPRKWVSAALDGDALWGECQGSGSKPYQVRVDLAEPAFKCSCPSRKFPCKHAIGLLLMHAAGGVKAGAKPQWVEEWLTERAGRAEKKKEKAEAPPKPVDLAAQAKRREQRLGRVADGLAGIKRWVDDLVKSGVATAPSRGYEFFDEQARRLVDAQAPGVARRVQQLAGIASAGGDGWQRQFLEQLALLHLLVRGFGQREALPDATRDLIDAAVGLPRTTEEVLAGQSVADRWQIVAQEVTVEASVRAQHTWLFGTQTRRAALVLAFAFGDRPFDNAVSLPHGFAFDGELCPYPGDGMRVLVKTKGELSPIAALDGIDGLDGVLDEYATRRAANPWLEGLGLPVLNVTPRRAGDRWTLVDAGGQALPMSANDADAWTMLALSGGEPIGVAVTYDGRRLRPLSAMIGDRFQRLAPRDASAEAAA